MNALTFYIQSLYFLTCDLLRPIAPVMHKVLFTLAVSEVIM